MNRQRRGTSSAKNTRLDESRAEKQNFILRAGLAKNINKLNYYARVMSSPETAANDASLRPYANELLSALVNILLTDNQVWNRVREVLQKRAPKSLKGLREDVTDSGLRSLISKSQEHGMPLEVVLEVYSRGASEGGERVGFDRVNSFLAGGKARTMDSDLLGEEVVAEKRSNTRTLSIIKK